VKDTQWEDWVIDSSADRLAVATAGAAGCRRDGGRMLLAPSHCTYAAGCRRWFRGKRIGWDTRAV